MLFRSLLGLVPRVGTVTARSLASSSAASPAASQPVKVLAANRGEIAIRIFRAATELDLDTVAIYSKEDINAVHRYKADQAFGLNSAKGPVAAYLDGEEIIKIAKKKGVKYIHPGYGFLSENIDFARRCEEEGLVFVGPTTEQLNTFGDKTRARDAAINAGLKVVEGSHLLHKVEEAEDFMKSSGMSYPIIMKASMGGGGKGMRIVMHEGELREMFERCFSEAEAAFGDGSLFIEKYIQNPRHIEVQVLGDGEDVVHLYERDCSVQRRHQKVVEIAPAPNLDPKIRENLCNDAVRLAKSVGYRNAGTVEFLLDTADGSYYFMEVNPRIQVEHTVTEQVTGVDLVQSQLRIAGGASLKDLGLTQANLSTHGYAIQCRITTEDPLNDFFPDTGRISTWRPATGFGVRLDGGSLHDNAQVLPFYDSMLVKITGFSPSFTGAAAKLRRALTESRIRGVKTNIPFLLNVLKHPVFLDGETTTAFIADHKELMEFQTHRGRADKLLNYLGDLVVNRTRPVGANGPLPAYVEPVMPTGTEEGVFDVPAQEGWKNILDKEGPTAFAKAVREHPKPLLTDTTWRDAHQSLLATRMRTKDILLAAPSTSHILKNLYSLENWGGATFDVAMQFLHECPWERLEKMRAKVPNIPFQMLLRGSNAVGYTSYPDNVVTEFCRVAKEKGMDVFRVFDSLNDMENMRVGIDAAGAAGGVVEGAICYTGDLTNPSRTKYTLDYYLNLAAQLVDAGVHVLCVKDMAGLLKPAAAKILIRALREEFPNVPIHVHTHDTSGLGVASMVECIHSGADVVDSAVDSMSGMTSQPSMGALVAHFLSVNGGRDAFEIDPEKLNEINEFWEITRLLYSPYESGQKSGSSDVFKHEIPGGQFTNLYFQATSLGLASRWREIKRAYAEANMLCGDIVKVTPSSKVVGDLAQFMVTNNLSAEDVRERASTLNFPSSVVEYFQGLIGTPPGGFDEKLRADILQGKQIYSTRPGAELPPADFEAIRQDIHATFSPEAVAKNPDKAAHFVSETDVLSAALYPKEYKKYREFIAHNGDVSALATYNFLKPLEEGEDLVVDIEDGKTLYIKLLAVGKPDKHDNVTVYFDVNGVPRSVLVPVAGTVDATSTKKVKKADPKNPNHLGAPMPGAVVEVAVGVGAAVEEKDKLLVLNAMKMETVVVAPFKGIVQAVEVSEEDAVSAGDLLVEIAPVVGDDE